MDRHGRNPVNLTHAPGFDSDAAWSPDGQQIAFGGYAKPDEMQLYVANADGEGLQELTDGIGMNCYPCWSPHGRYLAFVHFARHPNQTPDAGRLMLLDIDEDTTREFGAGAPRVTASRLAWRLAEEECRQKRAT